MRQPASFDPRWLKPCSSLAWAWIDEYCSGHDACAERRNLFKERRRRSGAIEIGDREEDVIQRFRRPDRISRTVSQDRISEQWIYQGPPPLYIFLERKPKAGEAVVTGIHAP